MGLEIEAGSSPDTLDHLGKAGGRERRMADGPKLPLSCHAILAVTRQSVQSEWACYTPPTAAGALSSKARPWRVPGDEGWLYWAS